MKLWVWDMVMVSMSFFAMFWLLASPLIPIAFDPSTLVSANSLFLWSLICAAPLSGVGMHLNRRVIAQEKQRQAAPAAERERSKRG